jgi:hypothetical protein
MHRLIEELGNLLLPAVKYTFTWQILSILGKEKHRGIHHIDGLLHQFGAWKLSRVGILLISLGVSGKEFVCD